LTATPEDRRICEAHQDTTAAERGTLGHSIVENILSGNWETAKELTGGPLYDDDLADDVGFCYEWVKDNVPTPDKGGLEVRLESGLLENFGGTMDVLSIVGDIAFIVDFKFGRELVEAVDNPQLLCYALLVYEHNPEVETFTVTILQGGEAKTVSYTRGDLDAFFQEVLQASISETWNAGDHCQYCPMRYRCGTLGAYVFEELDDAKAKVEAAAVSERPNPERVDDVVQIAKAGKLGKDAYDIASKTLKTWAADGVHLGDEAKVTETRRKKWNDFAEDELRKLLGDDAYTKKLKTPAQVAKDHDVDHLIDTTPTQVLRLGKNPPEFD
jgi:hypothetical protein